MFGRGLKAGDRVIDRTYRLGSVTYHRVRRADQEPKPFYNESGLPRLLFLGAGLLTLLTLLLLWRQMPDLFLRTLIWLRTQPRYRLEIDGLNHLPDAGPAIIITNAQDVDSCLHVVSATDRTTRFLAGTDENRLEQKAEDVLASRGVVGLSLHGATGDVLVERVLGTVATKSAAPVLPVWYERAPWREKKRRQRVYILAGTLLPPGSSIDDVRRELQRVAGEFKLRMMREDSPSSIHLIAHAE